MANTVIQDLRTITAGRGPTLGQVANGQIAMNQHDGKLYFKDDSNTIMWVLTANSSAAGNATFSVANSASTGVERDGSGNVYVNVVNATNVIGIPAALHMCLLNPVGGLYYFMGAAPKNAQIVSANCFTANGTCSANIWINGAAVSNLSAIAVSSTPTINIATGANTIATGNSIAVNLSSVLLSPTQLNITLNLLLV